MLCCTTSATSTPLALYARSLARQVEEVEAVPMTVPMYVVSMEQLLKMTEVRPHERLLAEGIVVEFRDNMGKALFVSHQWVGTQHPDPEGTQLRVLQQALRFAMSEIKYIPLDFVTELSIPSAKGLPAAALLSNPVFVWYDYFSCPQLEGMQQEDPPSGRNGPRLTLADAISSIPTYIAACSFFVALCPIIQLPQQSQVLSPGTWAARGWCAVERTCRELSRDESWIMVKSPTHLELVLGKRSTAYGGPPGEGKFTVPEDADKLAPVLSNAVHRKLLDLLRAQDFVSYRVLLNLRPVYLRGLRVEDTCQVVPGFHEDAGSLYSLAVQRFFFQNGFTAVDETDKGGWSPLHYAALSGDTDSVRGLLAQRADPNCKTKKDMPQVEIPSSTSPLSICVLHNHNEAARVLIAARAWVDGRSGVVDPALTTAAEANNAEGIRILCHAGCSPHLKNSLGISALQSACASGCLAAVEQLVAQAGETVDLSGTLGCAMLYRGDNADLVFRLAEMRADVNEPTNMASEPPVVRLWVKLKGLQYKLGSATTSARVFYHAPGATPLFLAMLTAQYTGAAALIALGARLDTRNARGWTAADFTRGPEGQSVPEFLRTAFRDRSRIECQRVAGSACTDGYVEHSF
ncbi:unnamed protein product [Symbiodinium sp. CCMP2592]|nr:unnamed protein product [Symbiodinium sp. CCMP2592]